MNLLNNSQLAEAKTENINLDDISFDNPAYYSKDVLSVGNFKLYSRGQELNINGEQLEAIIADTNRYIENGNSVEFIADHTNSKNKPFEEFDNERDKKSVINVGGYCKNFAKSRDGRWATCNIGATTKGGKALCDSTKDVSVELAFDHKDTQGHDYPAVIKRVASVQKPVIPNQKGYVKLSEEAEELYLHEDYDLTETQNEVNDMPDEKKVDELTQEDIGFFKKLMLKLSSEEEGKPSQADSANADKVKQLEEELATAKKEQAEKDEAIKKKDEELKAAKSNSLMETTKGFMKRIADLNIDADSKKALQVALGIDEDVDKCNAVYLSSDEEGEEALAESIIKTLENVKIVNTESKTEVKLSEYHETDPQAEADKKAEEDADAAYIEKEKAAIKNKIN